MHCESTCMTSQANCRYVVKASPDHILICDWSFLAPGQATHPW